ncbi:Golgi-associated plant pathogenesis-related protein 1-like isoform X1 [Montipora capricornis]|uniref:Golgi-associated plant pathogenesis-related protein 1-like isoform X1 n=1 Tax=Montipora capricornis TaxID=246305 RepID=UPI0035F1EEDC
MNLAVYCLLLVITGTPVLQSSVINAENAFSTGFSQQELNGLIEHNLFRAIHGVPDMTLNRTMCNAAALWAKEIAENGSLVHSDEDQRPGQGENLSMGCSSDTPQTVKEAVDNWYNEVCNPGYEGLGEVDTGPMEAGHFSQVIWKKSTKLGIGRAEIELNGMKCAFVVGRYEPAGNFIGTYRENVPKGTFDRATYCPRVAKKDVY